MARRKMRDRIDLADRTAADPRPSDVVCPGCCHPRDATADVVERPGGPVPTCPACGFELDHESFSRWPTLGEWPAAGRDVDRAEDGWSVAVGGRFLWLLVRANRTAAEGDR